MNNLSCTKRPIMARSGMFNQSGLCSSTPFRKCPRWTTGCMWSVIFEYDFRIYFILNLLNSRFIYLTIWNRRTFMVKTFIVLQRSSINIYLGWGLASSNPSSLRERGPGRPSDLQGPAEIVWRGRSWSGVRVWWVPEQLDARQTHQEDQGKRISAR